MSYQSTLNQVLAVLRAKRTPCILSRPGQGKSAMFRQIAAALDLKYIELFTPSHCPEDAMGLPMARNGAVEYTPQQWAVLASTTPCFLAVEELPAAAPSVRKSYTSLILDRKACGLALHPDTRIGVTGNRPEDAAGSEHLESHIVSRLVFFGLETTIQDLTSFWLKNRLPPEFPAYWQWQPSSFQTFDTKRKGVPYACPRSWHSLADILSANLDLSFEDQVVIAEGAIGPQGAAFVGFRKIAMQLPALDNFINAPDSAPLPIAQPEQLYALCSALPARAIEQKKPEAAFTLALRVQSNSPELGILMFKLTCSLLQADKNSWQIAKQSVEYRRFRDANLNLFSSKV